MRFPSIKDVADCLRAANIEVEDPEDGMDVRLQVCGSGEWVFHTGDSQYDQDHRGYWGCTSLDGKLFKSREVAKDLIDQVKSDYYMSQAAK